MTTRSWDATTIGGRGESHTDSVPGRPTSSLTRPSWPSDPGGTGARPSHPAGASPAAASASGGDDVAALAVIARGRSRAALLTAVDEPGGLLVERPEEGAELLAGLVAVRAEV